MTYDGCYCPECIAVENDMSPDEAIELLGMNLSGEAFLKILLSWAILFAVFL